MAEVAQALASERQKLEVALEANPNNAAAHVQLARLEAKLWSQAPETADLSRIAKLFPRAP